MVKGRFLLMLFRVRWLGFKSKLERQDLDRAEVFYTRRLIKVLQRDL